MASPNWVESTAYTANPISFKPSPIRNISQFEVNDFMSLKQESSNKARKTKNNVYGNGTTNDIFYNKFGRVHYQGEVVNRKANGEGCLFYPEGGVEYEGEFTDNLLDGYGQLYNREGD